MRTNSEITLLEIDRKSVQALLYILRNTKNLNKYALGKLLYYSDSLHKQKYSKTITNKYYIHIEKAPLPAGFNELLTALVSAGMIFVRPHIHAGTVMGMVFDYTDGFGWEKGLDLKEIRTLKTVCFLLGKKVEEESRIFPKLYEHYIISDLFSVIDFGTLPDQKIPKISRKRKIVEIGNKIYKILFENY